MAGQTFVEADIWTVAQTDQGNVVLVRPKGSEIAVPIFIGQLETQSILIGMGGVIVPRPLTHDLVVNVASAMRGEVARIEINDLRDGTFYARLVLRAESREIMVDARPSDAIGIAVRVACPVFIAESVIEEAGISVNLVAGLKVGDAAESATPTSPEPDPIATTSKTADIERLRAELEGAVADEDYERAATLRDKLRDLES